MSRDRNDLIMTLGRTIAKALLSFRDVPLDWVGGASWTVLLLANYIFIGLSIVINVAIA